MLNIGSLCLGQEKEKLIPSISITNGSSCISDHRKSKCPLSPKRETCRHNWHSKNSIRANSSIARCSAL